jgi:hypothetical protein
VRGDLIAGITLAAYLLPAALGDASLANLPPEAGLYACLFGGLVFWVFCSSRRNEGVDVTLGGINRFSSVAEVVDAFQKKE